MDLIIKIISVIITVSILFHAILHCIFAFNANLARMEADEIMKNLAKHVSREHFLAFARNMIYLVIASYFLFAAFSDRIQINSSEDKIQVKVGSLVKEE